MANQPATPDRERASSPWDRELWDDLNAVVYQSVAAAGVVTFGNQSAILATIEVPCPVRCRLQIVATAHLFGTTGDAVVSVNPTVDGAALNQALSKLPGHATVNAIDIADVLPGVHTVGLRVRDNTGTGTAGDVSFDRAFVQVRRGRAANR